MIPTTLLLKIVLYVLAILVLGYLLRFVFLLKATAKLDAISNSFVKEYALGLPSDPPLIYVALGDSTVQGTGCERVDQTLPYSLAQSLAARGNYVHVINLGVSGAKILDVRSKQLPKLIALKPDFISLNIGANDTTHFTSVTSYEQDMSTILDTLKPVSSIVANTPDMQGIPALPLPIGLMAKQRAIKQNRILERLTANRNVSVIDLYDNGKLTTRDLYAADMFHPSARGYFRWSELYKQIP